MSAETALILLPGALTTVQDLGRTGWQYCGVSVGGAMDPFAATVANILAGNNPKDAVLEITLLGPQIKILQDTTIAVAGADLAATLDGERIAPWSSKSGLSGQVLTFGQRAAGARAYLSINGGVDVPCVMGSRSTDLKALVGGYRGRALKAGDILSAKTIRGHARFGGRSLLPGDLQLYRPPNTPIRFLRSRGGLACSANIFDQFLSQSRTVRPDSDRMGYRFAGPQVENDAKPTDDSWSEPVTAGVIQIPPDGQPIVLMAGCQTVGGYPRVGVVITVDIGRLAQAAPSDAVQFVEVSMDVAQSELHRQAQYIAHLSVSNVI